MYELINLQYSQIMESFYKIQLSACAARCRREYNVRINRIYKANIRRRTSDNRTHAYRICRITRINRWNVVHMQIQSKIIRSGITWCLNIAYLLKYVALWNCYSLEIGLITLGSRKTNTYWKIFWPSVYSRNTTNEIRNCIFIKKLAHSLYN